MDFTEENIQSVFGHEAAESENIDRLKAYYFKSRVYNKVITDLPLRILVGHKGIGKSALFKVGIEDEKKQGRLTFLIRPDDVAGIGDDTQDFLSLITKWKIGINEILTKKILAYCEIFDTDSNLISKAFQAGVNLLDFLSDTINIKEKVDLNKISSKIKQSAIDNFLKNGKVSIYIDDLDRGWQGRREDIQRISTLLNAIRDISSDNAGVYFRISLRSDVYFLSRTSDESTDKTESSVIWFDWDNHEIFALLVKRIVTFSGCDISDKILLTKSQVELMSLLSDVIEAKFTGAGKWENAPMHRVLMSLIRKRPRDLVKLLTLSARRAKDSSSEIIKTEHLKSILDEYSQGRLQDTINEYISELPDIQRLILSMKPSKKQKKAADSFTFTTAQLLGKLESIQQQGKFKWQNRKEATTKELAAFLYKIGFITARKIINEAGEIDRKYFEQNRYLSNNFVDFGYDWEIHPAYRWALQPNDIYELLNDI